MSHADVNLPRSAWRAERIARGSMQADPRRREGWLRRLFRTKRREQRAGKSGRWQ